MVSKLTAEEREKRRKDAIALRLADVPWQVIADKCGYNSRSAAHKDVNDALKKLTADAEDDDTNLVLERLAVLHRKHWPKAQAGDLAAAHLILRIEQTRRRIKEDKQTPIVVVGPETTVLDEFKRRRAQRQAAAQLRPGTQG